LGIAHLLLTFYGVVNNRLPIFNSQFSTQNPKLKPAICHNLLGINELKKSRQTTSGRPRFFRSVGKVLTVLHTLGIKTEFTAPAGNGKKQVSMFEMTKLVSGHVKK